MIVIILSSPSLRSRRHRSPAAIIITCHRHPRLDHYHHHACQRAAWCGAAFAASRCVASLRSRRQRSPATYPSYVSSSPSSRPSPLIIRQLPIHHTCHRHHRLDQCIAAWCGAALAASYLASAYGAALRSRRLAASRRCVRGVSALPLPS